MKILVVEDDELTARALETVLVQQNYAVEIAAAGESAWDLVELFDYDLLLLDVSLPDLDGVSLCRRLRSHHYDLPIMLLTAKDSGHEKALGLDAGADDYLTKPFNFEELMARIRALLRRASDQISAILAWGALELDPESCEVTYNGQLVPLTPKEYALMELLLRNPKRVFSCGMVIEHLWAYEDTPSEDAVRTHIKCIRQKLKRVGAASTAIDTVYGIGYRLGPAEELVLKTTNGRLEPNPAATGASGPFQADPLPARNASSQAPNRRDQATAQSSDAQVLQSIAHLWQQFQPRIQSQIDQIEQALLAHSQQNLTSEQRAEAETNVHSLKGALGTFGFPEGSRLAGLLEKQLQAIASESDAANLKTAEQIASAEQQVLALRQAIVPSQGSGLNFNYPAPTPSQDYILMVDGDVAMADALALQAQESDLTVIQAKSLAIARRQLKQGLPRAVVLDPSISSSQASFKFLEELSAYQPPLPAFIWSAENDLEQRLAIARSGGQRFFDKSVAPEQVFTSMQTALRQMEANAGRILIVDDDPVILATLEQLLSPWGFDVTTLEDPRMFWQVLEQTQPDLLVLDVKMPYVSGIELCQVVRNDERWSNLSILILTAHAGADIVSQVFGAGADDVVPKPIAGPELVVRVLNRLERSKLLQRILQTDPLTGILNYQQSSRMLQQQLKSAHQTGRPFCLASVEIQDFRSINRRHGHRIGDRLLRHVGQSLSQALGSDQVVGRWGGEEFVIGLYNTELDSARRQLQQLLARLAQESLEVSPEVFVSPRFNFGVAAQAAGEVDLDPLYQAAEAAMYRSATCDQLRLNDLSNCISTPTF